MLRWLAQDSALWVGAVSRASSVLNWAIGLSAVGPVLWMVRPLFLLGILGNVQEWEARSVRTYRSGARGWPCSCS